MTELVILALLVSGQIVAMTIIFAVVQIGQRLSLTCRLRFNRTLSNTWSSAWRKAGFHLN